MTYKLSEPTLTRGAKDIVDKIGKGMVLAIEKSGHNPWLLPGPYSSATPVPVGVVDVREVLQSNLVSKLTKERNDCKLGWREMKLPGDQFDLYCLVQ